MTNDALLELVVAAFGGDAHLLRGWDAQSEESAIRFSYITVRFRVSNLLQVREVRGNMEHESVYADLMQKLLKATAERLKLQAEIDYVRSVMPTFPIEVAR